MPTHQSLTGTSDDDLVRRMVATHAERFGAPYWSFLAAHAAPALPRAPVAIDLGCGPGLWLRDFSERYPAATLYGYDVTPAMIAHGRTLTYAGAAPTLDVLDVTATPLPQATGSVHLVAMTAVLHVLDEPMPVLAEIRRVLAPGGIFALHDWIRQPLRDYLAWRRDYLGDPEPECSRRGFRLFAFQNKYTVEDWRWLLGEAGFAVRHDGQVRPTHHMFVASPC